jgi:poly(3-hydroxybutyrate) depolymerase
MNATLRIDYCQNIRGRGRCPAHAAHRVDGADGSGRTQSKTARFDGTRIEVYFHHGTGHRTSTRFVDILQSP